MASPISVRTGFSGGDAGQRREPGGFSCCNGQVVGIADSCIEVCERVYLPMALRRLVRPCGFTNGGEDQITGNPLAEPVRHRLVRLAM